MAAPKQLYKSTIVIWSEFDPETMTLEMLVREAVEGMALCEGQYREIVTEPDEFPDTDFFDDGSEPS